MNIFGKKCKPPLLSATADKVLVLVDWDNLFFCLYKTFRVEMHLDYRLKKLMEWIKAEIGEMLGDHGFVFAPEHLSPLHQQICIENNFKLIICPKKQIRDGRGKLTGEEDIVDETLIWFGKMMMRHPDVKFICLVSGDNDYVPLFEEASLYGVKRVLVPPTVDSLSRSKTLVRLIDKHPTTGKKMVLRLDQV